MKKNAWLFLAFTTPALGASTLEELTKVVAIQQAEIRDLHSQIAKIQNYVNPCSGYGEVVYNSVGNSQGVSVTGDANTLKFWKIPYADRLKSKGTLYQNLSSNYYNGGAYQNRPTVYTDLIEDLSGKVVVAMQASTAGFDSASMKFTSPVAIGGQADIFNAQLASGWASFDQDLDIWESGVKNCAVEYSGVTQHYSACWIYNLGADAEAVGDGINKYDDANWGPHLRTSVASDLGLSSDGTAYTRVKRITRCAR